MTLADMMLMILEINSNSGIWEELFQTVWEGDRPEVCFTHAHLVALSCICVLLLLLLSAVKFLCFSIIRKRYAEKIHLLGQIGHKTDFVSVFEGQKHGQNMTGR